VFHHLLLQNGGANIAESVYFVVARCERQRAKSTKETTPRAVFDCSLRSLRLALAAPAWLSAAARFPSAVFLLAATQVPSGLLLSRFALKSLFSPAR
jgi:hypothetical protein